MLVGLENVWTVTLTACQWIESNWIETFMNTTVGDFSQLQK